MSSVAVPAVSPSPLPRTAAALRQHLEASLAERIPAAFTVYDRSTPEMAASGIAALDALTGGLPRGALSEVAGPASSGRTSLLLAALAAATGRGEACALVDGSDAFDPESAVAAGVDLGKLLWVRCGKNPKNAPHSHEDTEGKKQSSHGFTRITTDPIANQKSQITNSSVPPCLRGGFSSPYARLDQALRAVDLLLAGGGFGLVAIDLGDVPAEAARRVPLASWFRFRRAVENTPTVLLLVGRQPVTQSCAALVLQLQPSTIRNPFAPAATSGSAQVGSSAVRQFGSCIPAHVALLTRLEIGAEVVRAPLRRKPAQSAHAEFETRAPWAV